MPYLRVNDADIYYDEFGAGPQTIVFSHGLLWSNLLFYKQIAVLKNNFRIIAYDHRGQGKSEVTKSGYDMDSLYEDAAQLIETLCPNEKVIFVGLSMGGFIGMRLAARKPHLVEKLILLETSCDPEPESNLSKYRTLNFLVKLFGVWAVSKSVMKIMFGKSFLTDPLRKAEKKFWINELNANKKTITKAVNGVIDRKGIDNELKFIICPTLVLVGDQDVATVPDKARKIQAYIKGSELKVLKGAGHTSAIEVPEQVNLAMMQFLGMLK